MYEPSVRAYGAICEADAGRLCETCFCARTRTCVCRIPVAPRVPIPVVLDWGISSYRMAPFVAAPGHSYDPLDTRDQISSARSAPPVLARPAAVGVNTDRRATAAASITRMG